MLARVMLLEFHRAQGSEGEAEWEGARWEHQIQHVVHSQPCWTLKIFVICTEFDWACQAR